MQIAGRYKSILCQTDQYLAELVRYIHLNPVRASMVREPEEFQYSSHRVYLGLEDEGLVDAEPILRHFGATKNLARQRFRLFVRAGMKAGHQEEFYRAQEGRILGTEEFVADTKQRVGEISRGARPELRKKKSQVDSKVLMKAVEKLTQLKRVEICSATKTRSIVLAKEALILIGRELGASNADMARLIGLDGSVVSRRYESAKSKMGECAEFGRLVKRLRVELAGVK